MRKIEEMTNSQTRKRKRSIRKGTSILGISIWRRLRTRVEDRSRPKGNERQEVDAQYEEDRTRELELGTSIGVAGCCLVCWLVGLLVDWLAS